MITGKKDTVKMLKSVENQIYHFSGHRFFVFCSSFFDELYGYDHGDVEPTRLTMLQGRTYG